MMHKESSPVFRQLPGLFSHAAQVSGCGSWVKQLFSSLLPPPMVLDLTLLHFHHLGYLLHYHSPWASASFSARPSTCSCSHGFYCWTHGSMLVTDSALVPDLCPTPLRLLSPSGFGLCHILLHGGSDPPNCPKMTVGFNSTTFKKK